MPCVCKHVSPPQCYNQFLWSHTGKVSGVCCCFILVVSVFALEHNITHSWGWSSQKEREREIRPRREWGTIRHASAIAQHGNAALLHGGCIIMWDAGAALKERASKAWRRWRVQSKSKHRHYIRKRTTAETAAGGLHSHFFFALMLLWDSLCDYYSK